MYILGIETSCDETSAAVIEGHKDEVILKSNIISSSLKLHAKTGGIIPESAAREQIKFILPVIEEALKKAFGTSDTFDTLDTLKRIDAIALTYGPGLIGSLLVGIETAKTISYVFNKPIIPVNHMVGHIYANFINEESKVKSPARGERQRRQKSKLTPSPYTLTPAIEFPAIALVVSGGHTDLLLMEKHAEFRLLGGTRDDAAGEAFDKIGRLLGLSYPAGAEIEKLAIKGNKKRFRFPRPLIGSADFDFSFSGLKTAVLRETQNINTLDAQTVCDISYSTQEAIVDVLVKKTLKAAEKYSVKSILISGGVAANQKLRDSFKFEIGNLKLEIGLFAPAAYLCTDNAAMIASAAFFNFQPVRWDKVSANPELYF